jgi:type IV pilus assembly protein PilC
MGEFRFTGTNTKGQPVQGTVFAPNKRTANKKVGALADRHRFQLRALDERAVFLFKAKHPSGKVI